MDVPPPDNGINWVAILTCGFFGGVGASLTSLRKRVAVYQVMIAVTTALMIAASIPFALMSLAPSLKWYIGAPLALFTGLLIFGILVAIEKSESKIGKLDITKVHSWWFRKSNREEPKP